MDNISVSSVNTDRDHLMLTATISTNPEDIVEAYDLANISRYPLFTSDFQYGLGFETGSGMPLR